MIKLKVTGDNGNAVIAMDNNEIVNSLVRCLPLTLRFEDINLREKYIDIDSPLAGTGDKKTTFEVGDFSYWPAGPGLVFFYRQDNKEVKTGVIRLGKVISGMELFDKPSELEVTIEQMTD